MSTAAAVSGVLPHSAVGGVVKRTVEDDEKTIGKAGIEVAGRACGVFAIALISVILAGFYYFFFTLPMRGRRLRREEGVASYIRALGVDAHGGQHR